MFDPTKPATGSPDSSAEMRDQLNGLKDLIDAIPAGPQGNDGTQGLQGVPGVDGAQGPQGIPGPPGPSVAGAVVDGVSTLAPGSSASVSTGFDGTNVHFSFGIPRGDNGAQGNDGTQGPPGEVSSAVLLAAVAGTSANTNGVNTLDTPFTNDPPTLADIEVLRAKINELITALRR